MSVGSCVNNYLGNPLHCPSNAYSIADIETKVGYVNLPQVSFKNYIKDTCPGYFSGTNVTLGKNDQSQSGTMQFWNDIGHTALCVGSSYIPFISTLKKDATTIQEFYNLYSKYSGPATTYMSSTSSDTCGNTVMQSTSISSPICSTFGIDNGTKCRGGLGGPFTNYFAGISCDELYIPYSCITSSCLPYHGLPGIKIQSIDLMNPSDGNTNLWKEASSSICIPIRESVYMSGIVTNGGSSYDCKPIYLIQDRAGTYTEFQLKTNSNGKWSFFGQPGDSYILSDENYFGASSSLQSWGFKNQCAASASQTQSSSMINAGNFNMEITYLSGTVTANNNPVECAGADVLINSVNACTVTNSQGKFGIIIPMNSSVSVAISAAPYSYNTQSVYVGSDTTYSMTFSYTSPSTSGGGGGGGCVLYGTNITLANGLTTQVQNLYKGEKILSYNTHTHKLFKDKVKQIIITNNVTSVIRIDNFISLSGPNVQPVYVKTALGKNEWIFLGQITKGMSLYNPQNNTWVKVTNITIVIGHFTVYEVVGSKEFWAQGHKRSDYIANGILVDRKLY